MAILTNNNNTHSNIWHVLSCALVLATPGSALSKRPREEEQECMPMDAEPQEEPTEPPISKKLRMQRVGLEVRL